MRAGEREAAAIFITRYGSRLRRRIRGKLSSSMRRVFDSQDILSTVGRMLDVYVRDGKMEAASELQLWSLVLRMADNAVINKAKLFGRLEKVEEEDGPFAREVLRRLHEAESRIREGAMVEIERAIDLFKDNVDRQVLTLWLVGRPLGEIAELLDLTSQAVRKRWQTIKSILQMEFAPTMRR